MKKTEFIMGMPVIVDIVGGSKNAFEKVFNYFREIDEKFSPYKANSEVTKINDSRTSIARAKKEVKKILQLSNDTKEKSNGYFDIFHNGYMDPSGIVKGWAIYNASQMLKNLGYKNFYVEAGGDIQTYGLKSKKKWAIGIRNPFNTYENVKVVYLNGEGIATSGTYEKGNHIYNPKEKIDNNIKSITIIAPNIYEADRFATAAFAMGEEGINFIEKQKDLEGYMIDVNGIATMTSGFHKYATKS